MKRLLAELRAQGPNFSDALLDPLLTYLLKARKVAGGDFDLNLILMIIALRTIAHPEFTKLSMHERLNDVDVFPTRGVNTQSISESLGIPRETVRRKVAQLERKGWIVRIGQSLHFSPKAFVELSAIREAREELGVKFYEVVRDAAAKLPPATS